MCVAPMSNTLFKGDNYMLETLKKILEQEKKTKDKQKLIKAKQAETDYYFDREIEILKLQGKLKETHIGEDND